MQNYVSLEESPELNLELGLYTGVNTHTLADRIRELRPNGVLIRALGGGYPEQVVTGDNDLITVLRLTGDGLLDAPTLV